jgi:hypothetical protein
MKVYGLCALVGIVDFDVYPNNNNNNITSFDTSTLFVTAYCGAIQISKEVSCH